AASASSPRCRSGRCGSRPPTRACRRATAEDASMEFFRIHRDIPFMRHARILNAISIVMFLLAVFFLAARGLHLSIEFTGGTVMEVHDEESADLPKIRAAIGALGYEDAQVQNFGTSHDVLIRLPSVEGSGKSYTEQSNEVMAALQADNADATLQRVEFVGPQVGRELFTDGAMALLFVVVGIIIYLSIRFEWKFAVAAIIANLHDVVIILGFFAAFQRSEERRVG